MEIDSISGLRTGPSHAPASELAGPKMHSETNEARYYIGSRERERKLSLRGDGKTARWSEQTIMFFVLCTWAGCLVVLTLYVQCMQQEADSLHSNVTNSPSKIRSSDSTNPMPYISNQFDSGKSVDSSLPSKARFSDHRGAFLTP